MLRQLASLILLALSALSIAAIWSIISMISGGLGPYFAPICAIAIVGMSLAFGWQRGFLRGALAALMTLICIAYQSFLFAAGTIAGLMGLSLSEAVRSMGVELTMSIIRAHTSNLQLAMYALAIVLAFALGWIFDLHYFRKSASRKRSG